MKKRWISIATIIILFAVIFLIVNKAVKKINVTEEIDMETSDQQNSNFDGSTTIEIEIDAEETETYNTTNTEEISVDQTEPSNNEKTETSQENEVGNKKENELSGANGIEGTPTADEDM